MDHLVVGEYQHKILAVGVQHAKGQPAVMVAAEIGIALHISQKIIHPAHVPLIIKAQRALFHIPGDLRPCRGLLGNKHSSFGLLLENGI